MEKLSFVHRENLVKFCKNRKKILVLTADLTGSCEADLFKEKYPERFISCGISEQNMHSVAGGLAREGFIPFIHTFAVFIYRRAYDQIAMSIAYPALPVKMFGFLPGITTPGGATHQAIEDIAVMRALPNMTVLEVADATEVESVLDVAYSINGPVYIRMLRGEILRIFDKNSPLKLDTPKLLLNGKDILIISSGICTEEAIKATMFLKTKNVSVSHLHISTFKPFDNKLVPDILNSARYGIITVENHTVIGGLGTIISEKIAEFKINKRIIKLGLQDTFAHGASKSYLMKEYGFDAFSIIKASEKLLNNKLDVKYSDINDLKIENKIKNFIKPEDL